MTLYRELSIHCDYPDCLDSEDVQGLPGQSAATVRKQAKSQGWRRIAGRDYCPAHASGEAPTT